MRPSNGEANRSVSAARGAALPHHLWYVADIDTIVAAERHARDEKGIEGLMLLATSVQVRPLMFPLTQSADSHLPTQIDERHFPIYPPRSLTSPGYVAYWFWDLRAALKGTGKVDNTERFCARFLLSLDNDNHCPIHVAVFIREICSKVQDRTRLTIELDDIAFRISAGMVSGYIQWRTGHLHDIHEWVLQHGTLWLTDTHGPIYFETTSSVIGHYTIKAWHTIIEDAIECVFLTLMIIH